MRKIIHTEYIFEIENFLSAGECDDLISLSEEKGYEEAKVNVDGQQTMLKGVRNNERLLVENPDWAQSYLNKASEFLPQVIGESKLSGFNELFRFYKYFPGQRFKRHRDGSFVRNEKEASYYTFMIYLNAHFTGGETKFSDDLVIIPKKGNALVFLHPLHHEGCAVIDGVKYVLRTDVMYKLSTGTI